MGVGPLDFPPIPLPRTSPAEAPTILHPKLIRFPGLGIYLRESDLSGCLASNFTKEKQNSMKPQTLNTEHSLTELSFSLKALPLNPRFSTPRSSEVQHRNCLQVSSLAVGHSAFSLKINVTRLLKYKKSPACRRILPQTEAFQHGWMPPTGAY